MAFDVFSTPNLYEGPDFSSDAELEKYLSNFKKQCKLVITLVRMNSILNIITNDRKVNTLINEFQNLLSLSIQHIQDSVDQFCKSNVDIVTRETAALRSLQIARSAFEQVDFNLLMEIDRKGQHAEKFVELVQDVYRLTRDGSDALRNSIERPNRKRTRRLWDLFRFR
jgi:hypothetical protein